jgi:thioester reductase-like protein
VTGFPAFTAKRMLARILEEPSVHALVLVRDPFARDLETFARALPGDRGRRIEPVLGDVAAIDLGLSGEEVKRLFREVTEVYHLAAIYHLGVPRDLAEQVNVRGTRNVLELAASMRRLTRFHHFSTAYVSGRREGVILEGELLGAGGFYNHYEETRYRAELIARRFTGEVPVTVYRPSIIVGDSRTGEIDKFAGPYYFMIAIVTAPIEIPLPLPGRGDGPLNLVPIDFVTEAAWRIGRRDDSVGGTYHLVDPQPLPARRVFELVAERAGKPLPRGVIPGGRLFWELVSSVLSRVPRLDRALSDPRQTFEQFHHHAHFDSSNTQRALAGTGVACPPFERYIDILVRYIRSYYEERRRRRREEALYDPLA